MKIREIPAVHSSTFITLFPVFWIL